MTIKKHKHHIIPKHAGGTDCPENLIELTVEEHIQAHLDLYEKEGKYQDLCAANLLKASLLPNFRENSCRIAREAKQMKADSLGLSSVWYLQDEETQERMKDFLREIGKIGGIKGGETNRISGHMSNLGKSMSLEDRKRAGSKGGNATIKSGKGAFGNPEERREVARLGGKVQGKINGENGHLAELNRKRWEQVRSGERIEKKRKWYTDGNKSISIVVGDIIPEGFYPGRTLCTKK